jgi:DNA-binding response OmpR family regulator
VRVLVVDDEEMVRKSVRQTCESEGHEVEELSSGAGVLDQVKNHPPDVVLLDLVLPDTSGFDICRSLRAEGMRMPVIILSAKNEEIDVVLGLEIGADDYIQKPFRPRELLARLASQVRKTRSGADGEGQDGVLTFRGITIHLDERRVERDGEEIPLTHTEFDLLALLAAQAGNVVSRDRILASVWGYERKIETRVIDVHIRNLRRKVEVDPSQPRFILSVPGIGYRFAATKP